MVITTTKVKGIEARIKAKKTASQEYNNRSRGQKERQAKRRAHQGYTEALAEVAASSLSAAAVSPATEMNFLISSIIARKEQALKTIEDCDIAITVLERLGL